MKTKRVILEVPEEVLKECGRGNRPEPTKDEKKALKNIREDYPIRIDVKFKWPWWIPFSEDAVE